MSKSIIFSLNESPEFPNFSYLYDEMGYEEVKFFSIRKITQALKETKPTVIVAQFYYAFASNYASNHICNLDSLLITLQNYPDYKPVFVFLVHKDEYKYLDQLTKHYEEFSKINHGLILPVKEEQIRALL